MPQIKVEVDHKLAKEEAKQRVLPAMIDLILSFEGTEEEFNWDGDQCDFKFKSRGFGIKGNCIVGDDAVATEVTLPWAAMVFKERVIKAINKCVGQALVDKESTDCK